MKVTSEAFWLAPLEGRARHVAAAVILAIVGVLLFARLDHYALWDDEANTALFAQGIWQTGDTTAVIDHNIVGYRNGAELDESLHNRRIPPLQYFVAAPFVRDGNSAFWARFPFALAGFATVAFLLFWLTRVGASRRTWLLTALAIVGNVSFYLYCRQSRYYALTLLFTVLMVYAYAQRDRGWRMHALLAVSSIGLLASQYLCYAGMVAALGADYLLWGRARARYTLREMAVLAATQLVAVFAIVGTWFPMQQVANVRTQPWVIDRIHLWMKTLRDINTCEFGVILLMIAAPIIGRRSEDTLLRRLPFGIALAAGVVSFFSPQGSLFDTADIRYVCFLIPGCLLLCIRVIEALPLRGLASIALGVIAFQTNVLHWTFARAFAPETYEMQVRNTLVWYASELRDPPPSAYRLASEWMTDNAPRGESVLVLPDYGAYPLMFHAPHLVYGWQFERERADALGGLPEIQLKNNVPPDWVIYFGLKDLARNSLGQTLSSLGATYSLRAEFPVTGVDRSRPELVWHWFHGTPYSPKAPLTIWKKDP